MTFWQRVRGLFHRPSGDEHPIGDLIDRSHVVELDLKRRQHVLDRELATWQTRMHTEPDDDAPDHRY